MIESESGSPVGSAQQRMQCADEIDEGIAHEEEKVNHRRNVVNGTNENGQLGYGSRHQQTEIKIHCDLDQLSGKLCSCIEFKLSRQLMPKRDASCYRNRNRFNGPLDAKVLIRPKLYLNLYAYNRSERRKSNNLQ